MGLFDLNKVSRYYVVGKKKKYVLKDVSLSLPNHGLITILGKSGSGKSTLLNLLGKIDTPSEGTIFFNNENINKYNEKKTSLFHGSVVSFVFQHYHLLDRQTALYNVMLPALINGKSYKTAKEEAIALLNDFSINKELFNKKCADLSGGERERIAVLRAFINKPLVLLADEPTGALDKTNSVLVMESLKKISKEALVILVTHNQKLARDYSDRIIHMQDGKIIQDERINNLYLTIEKLVVKNRKRKGQWLNQIINSNFAKRFKRNIFTISALIIGLVSSMLIFGFTNGKDQSIVRSMEKQFDYGSATINKENKIKSSDSPITLIQTIRPSADEMIDLSIDYPFFHVCYSYDALLSPYPEISFNDAIIEDLSYMPIYSFIDESTNHNLLLKGKIPTFDTLNQVVINTKAYEQLNERFGFDSLNSYVRIKDSHSYSYYTDDIETPYITDYFTYDRLVQIVGVVDEITFLNMPKIYYSFVALDKYLDEVYLNNLSSYQGEITWKERVVKAQDNDDISSYTCRLFLKDIADIKHIKRFKDKIEDYAITSNALTIEETLFSLVEAASLGMEVFLGIALVGVAMIIGIISFASYNEDIKDSAILLCLGARRDDIAFIYVAESMLLGIIGIMFSFLFAFLLTKPINLLIEATTSLINIIDIPFTRFYNRPFLFPALIFVSALFICVFSTYLPIGFSKKISLKEELKAND